MNDDAIKKIAPPAVDDESPKSLVPVLQDWYAYYRRCSQLRSNGEQCKGPAMKGETVCYSHFNQAELQRFRERKRRELFGALGRLAGTRNEVGRAIHRISMAFLAGEIDEKTAGKMIREIEVMISAAKREGVGTHTAPAVGRNDR